MFSRTLFAIYSMPVKYNFIVPHTIVQTFFLLIDNINLYYIRVIDKSFFYN